MAALLPAPVRGTTEEEYIRKGHDHYFNLEYDQAVASYREALALDPEDPNTYNHIATAILFKELNRLGMLETSAFKGDNKFLEREKPQPDPEAARKFNEALFAGRERAEKIVDKEPANRMALFALAQNYGLYANYQFMIERSYVAALRNGQRAHKYSNKLRKLYPDFVDGYLVAGVQEYVVGSLPWAIRAVIALGGVRGSKEQGEDWVTLVANKGTLVRTEARVLLTLLHRRERRPLKAAELLEGLLAEYPRNYVFRLELAAMYEDAARVDRALQIFRETKGMVERNAAGYGRMPERLRGALDRKIDQLQERLAGTNRAANPQAPEAGRAVKQAALPSGASAQH